MMAWTARDADAPLPPGVVRLRWLGQAGFVIEAAGVTVLVDPWLSPHELRLAPAPLEEDLPLAVGWLLATHGHADHLDLPAIATIGARRPDLRVAVPTPLVPLVDDRAPGVRVTGVQPGDRLVDAGLEIEVVPAWHGVKVEDGYGPGPAGDPTPHVGYVLRLAGTVIYHAGDTIASAALIEALRPMGIDVALLPVNGRDYFREEAGILGNLDAVEAVRLAHAIGAGTLVPMHHDMVRGNTAPAGAVADAVAALDLPIIVIAPNRHRPITLFQGRAA
jgi:L-ascorbate metabolism protein UlaG (beta-lactamase superfamily)